MRPPLRVPARAALRTFAARLLATLGLSHGGADIDDEIRDHLDRSAGDFAARGLDREAARAAAAAAFGGRLQARERYADLRSFPRIESIRRDGLYALRGFRRAPLFASTVVATLGLAVGASTAIFAMVNAVVLRPLPYRDPDRLVDLAQRNRETGRRASVSPPNFFDLRGSTRTLAAVGAYWTPAVTLSAPGGVPERTRATLCTANVPDLLGVAPALGRSFSAGDDAPAAPRVALISNGLWRRRFGGDPAILGRDVLVDEAPVTVIGVMPKGFAFPVDGIEL